MIRKYAVSVLAGVVLVLGGSAPALADRAGPADLAPNQADSGTQRSILDIYNTWMVCEEAWLVSLDQMYPEDFSVSECMDVIDTHHRHDN